MLNAACNGIRSLVHISNINTVKSIYYAYFHSIIKYGIVKATVVVIPPMPPDCRSSCGKGPVRVLIKTWFLPPKGHYLLSNFADSCQHGLSLNNLANAVTSQLWISKADNCQLLRTELLYFIVAMGVVIPPMSPTCNG
jgi:hypothetical protein